MMIQEKIKLLEKVMDVEEGQLKADTILSELEEWDSLSKLALIAEMKQRYQINVTTDILKSFETVNDICEFIPN